jgi:hypothetical protein
LTVKQFAGKLSLELLADSSDTEKDYIRLCECVLQEVTERVSATHNKPTWDMLEKPLSTGVKIIA